MWMVVNETPSPTSSELTTLDHASRAALEATYAENRGGLVCTPIELTLTMCPDPCSRIAGSSPITSRMAPK